MEQLDEEMLLTTLNSLMANLELPLVLESTLDLTPSVILVIYESMLRTRLAVPKEFRSSKHRKDRIFAMKIFLGVLSDDVLGITAGIDRIDPVRLVDGCPEETTRVAELFCWLAKKMNFIADDGANDNERAASPCLSRRDHGDASASPTITAETTVDSRVSLHAGQSESDDQTTVMADESFVLDVDSDAESDAGDAANAQLESNTVASSSRSNASAHRTTPSRCIHELSFVTPSRYASHRNMSDHLPNVESSIESYCDCTASTTELPGNISQSVRQSGWISPVRLQDELQSFTTSRNSSNSSRSTPLNPRSLSRTFPETPLRSRPITRHTSPSQHTLALLNERARLLEELSYLKSEKN